MKVLFATYPMAFHTPGGGEAQLLAYERELRLRGVEVSRLDPWHPRFLEHDLVHFFSVVGGSSHLCGFVRQLGLPLVVSSSLWITPQTIGDFPADEIRHQLHLADRVITNSPSESETLASTLGVSTEKLRVVRNAVDPHFLVPADGELFRQAYQLDGPYVLCVGNIEPRKNQLRLAEAMSGIPDCRLVLIGGVRDDAYLAAVQRVAGPQLLHVGRLEQDDVLLRSAYAACSVFALPSLFETPGLAALEAAGQGAPIVITRHGAARDYFGTAAIYVDPDDVPGLRQAISKVLAAGASPLSRSGATPYTVPTWGDAVAELLSVYREVVGAGPRAGQKA